jgi:hypothetical protein
MSPIMRPCFTPVPSKHVLVDFIRAWTVILIGLASFIGAQYSDAQPWTVGSLHFLAFASTLVGVLSLRDIGFMAPTDAAYPGCDTKTTSAPDSEDVDS